MQIRYTAKRALDTTSSPIHTSGTEYTFDVVLKELNYSRKVESNVATSLSGVTQTTYYRTDVMQQVETVPVTGSTLRSLREFLASVEAGERFEFDDGSGFAQFKIDGSHTESRVVRRGDGGGNDYFTFRWTQRAI